MCSRCALITRAPSEATCGLSGQRSGWAVGPQRGPRRAGGQLRRLKKQPQRASTTPGISIKLTRGRTIDYSVSSTGGLRLGREGVRPSTRPSIPIMAWFDRRGARAAARPAKRTSPGGRVETGIFRCNSLNDQTVPTAVLGWPIDVLRWDRLWINKRTSEESRVRLARPCHPHLQRCGARAASRAFVNVRLFIHRHRHSTVPRLQR